MLMITRIKTQASGKIIFLCIAIIVGGTLLYNCSAIADSTAGDKTTENSNPVWRLGPTAYSFRLFSLFEAIEKTEKLGLNYIEIYVGQRICSDSPEKVGVGLSDEWIEKKSIVS